MVLTCMRALAPQPVQGRSRNLIELDNKIDALHAAGRYAEAIPLAEQAVQRYEAELGKNHLGTSDALNWLATLYMDQGRYAEAEPLYKRALAIREKALGAGHPGVADSVNNLANLYTHQGRYAEAEPLYKRALAICEKALRPGHPKVAANLHNLANLYEDQGRHADAEPLFKRALEINEKELGAEHPDVAKDLYGLAGLLLNQGRYAEAEPLFKRALAIGEKALSAGHPDVAPSLTGLAILYREQGRFDAAEPLFKRVLKIEENALGSEHPRVANSLNNLAALYADQGRNADAEALYTRVLAIREKTLRPEHPDLAESLSNLAIVYREQGRYSEAEALDKRSLAINEKAFGREHVKVAHGLWGLEASLNMQGRYAEAEPILKRVLALYERALPETHPTVSNILNQLGFLYREMGRDVDAEPIYRQALAMREKSLPGNHPDIAVNLANIAALELRQGRDLESLNTIRRANAIMTQRRASLKKSTDYRLLDNNWFFTHHVRAAFRVADRDKANATSLMQEAFRIAQWANDTAASSAAAQMAARLGAGDTGLGRLVRERQDLENRWQTSDKALTSALSLPLERRAGADERARRQLAEIDARLAAVDVRLKAQFPQYFALVKGEPVESDEIARLLDPNEALVQYVFAKEEGFAWLITRSTQRWARIALDAHTLSKKISALDCGLDPADWDDDRGRDVCRQLVGTAPEKNGPLPFDVGKAYELYQVLLGSFASEIAGKRLLIAGFPAGLPLAVLVTEKPSEALPTTADGYRGIKWLGTQHAITTLPSIASLHALRTLAHAGRAPELFIGFGDPALRGNPSCGKPALPVSCPGAPGGIGQRVATLFGTTAKRSPRRSVTRAPLQGMFKGKLADVDVLRAQCPLPEASFELKCVAESLGVPQSQIQVREKATETAVKQAPLERYQIVHFATHGLLASETKQATGSLAEPALLLTPPQLPAELDDGLLTASEIAQLKLNADWVVLSACNTAGAGDPTSGEALSGLARAFFYAGARALLVSEWAVDSDAAVLLTTGAFAELRQDPSIGRAEALRRSMQAVIKDTSRPDAAHPSFWAPFVVVGEGGAGR
jgi:CHAT domain-containing protein/tetratricopeptide (TPR) repeat protein